jgi:PEP-CTERM motif
MSMRQVLLTAANAVLLAMGMASQGAFAASVTLLPTADGQVTQNGQGAAIEVLSGGDVITATLSGPLSSTLALEFNLAGVMPTQVTGAQLILTQFGNTGTSLGQSTLLLSGSAGDGLITLSDLDGGGPLAVKVINNTIDMPWRTEYVFDINPASLFSLSSSSAVTLYVKANDPDGVTRFAFFALESQTIDYDLIAPGIQAGVPARLVLTTSPVPEPSAIAMVLAGLASLSVVARQRRARQVH